MCVCMCVFKRDISISPPYDVWIFFTDEYCSGVNIFQGWTFFNSNLEFAQITLVLLYAILCKNTIGLRKLSKKIVQRSDLANKTKTTTNVNQPNPTNTLPIRIQTYNIKMPISSTILWQDKISMSQGRQQFTNTGQSLISALGSGRSNLQPLIWACHCQLDDQYKYPMDNTEII